MPQVNAQEIYKQVKYGHIKFDEERHCILLLQTMSDTEKGTMSAFCVAAGISDKKFYKWLKLSETFLECYALGNMFARENWEIMGREIMNEQLAPGSVNYKFDYWRTIGWSRFGVGKNARIRLDLDPNGTPNQHYKELIAQAANGDFTAGEIKQLMEAINVGLNTHQVFLLQKEIDQLKADLATMNENTNNGNNTFANKGS